MSLTTPLYENHVKRKGKMVPFGGYLLPVWFSSLKEEHAAVRQHAGIFDISHMGILSLSGPEAFSFLQWVSCNNLEKCRSGKMVYSMLLNEAGCILDDIMVGGYDNQFLMVVNASNKAKILAWLNSKKPTTVTIEDLAPAHGFIAVQGPKAVGIVEATCPTGPIPPRFSLFKLTLNGHPCLALRTGYTGEDGLELIVPAAGLSSLWDQLIAAGITPCGLGARDTLRLEAGLPLYGQELSESITPLMTRYAWVVKWDKDFIGKAALLTQKESPLPQVTVGLEMTERIIPRSHYPLIEGGEITSGTLSPSLDKPIAMALISPRYAAIGTEVHVEIRGVGHKARVVEVPFK